VSADLIRIACQQGTPEWLAARAGACTASRFTIARSMVDGLTDQQAAYVAAIKAGKTEAEAMLAAGYKAKPSSSTVAKALAGEPVGRPSDAALKYAQLLAIERISGQPEDDTFQTWAMRRGQELEPVARELYQIRTGNIVDEAGVVLTQDRRFGYSTDGAVFGQRGGIEIKCPAAADKVAGVWLDPEPVIAEYLDQCDGGMWLEGWEWIDLVVYTPWLASVGRDLFVHRIHRDENRIEALERDLIRFTRLVKDYEQRLRAPLELAQAA
jgi:hypothetical protein